MQNFNVVYFKDLNLDAEVSSVGGCTPNSTTTARNLPVVNPSFFLSCDDYGNDVLCSIQTCCGNITLTAGGNNFSAITAPLSVWWGVFFGGHPVHHYK